MKPRVWNILQTIGTSDQVSYDPSLTLSATHTYNDIAVRWNPSSTLVKSVLVSFLDCSEVWSD